MIYADDVSILNGSVRTIKKSVEALVVIELEVNADKTKYMVKSPDQGAGRSHIIKTDSNSFGRVEEFKYLGTTLTIKILFRKKLRAARSQGMLTIIRCRIFRLPVCYPKM